MTVKQFETLDLYEMERIQEELLNKRTLILSHLEEIMEKHFRYLQNDGWNEYQKPINNQALRDYFLTEGLYLFLNRLENRLEEIYCTKLRKENL